MTGHQEQFATSPYNIPEGGGPGQGRKVTIYDSTLRDGEQTAGVFFSPDVKVAIARALDEAGVPEIEAGFPPVSQRERETIRRIAGLGLQANVLVLCRARPEDVDLARQCDADFMLMFAPGSSIHTRTKMGKDPVDLLPSIEAAIAHAQDQGIPFSFSTEDTTRMELSDMDAIYGRVRELGVKRIGMTDTAGAANPRAISFLVEKLRSFGPDAVSIHLHNDFGMGVANALSGVQAGATHVACTVNGLGERGGNVSLEQFVVSAHGLYGMDTGIDTTRLTGLSRLVEEHSGRPLPRGQPVVGDYTFAHESGIHIHAQLKDTRCYEPMTPESVGNDRRFIIGKHTGHHAIEGILLRNGFSRESIDALDVSALVSDLKRRTEVDGPMTEEALVDFVRALSEV